MKSYLKSFKLLTEDEIDMAINQAKPKTLSKNEYLIKAGMISKNVSFIKSGILRSSYHTSVEEEVTYCLTFPNNFVTAYASFISQNKSNINIQAITEVKLLVLSKDKLDVLVNKSTNWLRFSKLMAENEFMELEQRVFLLQSEKAEKRYQDLLINNPKYVQQVPLNYLASYLGITQRHLSRIRNNIRV